MRAVSEAELMERVFTARDAILISDSTQLDFVMSKANGSIATSWLIPVSTQAYEAILALRHDRVRSYFEFVDFADCMRWYHEEGLEHARAWLKELGLGFEVEGIDVVQLDAPCQFLLFTQARYIETTIERLVRASADIETFFVVTTREPFPLDFYFDSDVAAAVTRFVCERLGCHIRPIIMEHRSRFVYPQFRNRPITDVGTHDQSTLTIGDPSGARVGIAPATIANQGLVLDGLRDLGCEILFFPSIWSGEDAYGASNQGANEYICRLSPFDDDQSAVVASELTDLRRAVADRSHRSTLPASVIRNPHLTFQLDHILGRRWLSYANMIRRAARFVPDHPLDLFILSDHFTAEGAILSRLYRRRRTRILISPHSGWPCDANWATWESSDAAMMPSRSAAIRIKALSGMCDVHVTGITTSRGYRSLFHASASQRVSDARKRIAQHRKIVVVVTNSLELNGVPFVDLQRHFDAVSRLAEVPPSLQSRIVLAIRPKPKPLGEGPILYRALCGCDAESFALLEGLSFSQAIDVADCVVGVNVPTTGYFEVMEKGVPLIQLQTARVTTLHPDLPPEVVGLITDVDEIWPAIEAVLFDEDRRRRLLELQQQFITDDFHADACGDGDPVVALLNGLIHHGSSSGQANRPTELRQDSSERIVPLVPQPMEPEPLNPPVQKGTFHSGVGNVDDVLVRPDGWGNVFGWAADVTVCQPARAIHVFFDGSYLGTSYPTLLRGDVAAALKDQRVLRSGFKMRVKFARDVVSGTIRVCAELHDRSLFELLNAVIGTCSQAGDNDASGLDT